MKYLLRTGLILTLIIIVIACKKHEEKSMVLIRDCTATYLRDGDIDLPIANSEELMDLDSGQVITAKFYFPKTKKVDFKYGEDCGIDHNFPRGEWIFVEEF